MDKINKFSFIKLLETPQEILPHATNTIKYQQYIIVIENKDVSVLIPLREVENFERTISDYTQFTKEDLREILRKFRGITHKG